jgi:hypothetical protein
MEQSKKSRRLPPPAGKKSPRKLSPTRALLKRVKGVEPNQKSQYLLSKVKQTSQPGRSEKRQ